MPSDRFTIVISSSTRSERIKLTPAGLRKIIFALIEAEKPGGSPALLSSCIARILTNRQDP